MKISVQIPDDKKNDLVSKRLDILEKNLDRQYKTFIDQRDYIKVIERLQKSFMDKLGQIVSSANNNRDIYEKRIENLRKEFNTRIKEFKIDNTNDEILKSFAKKLISLEGSIKNIPSPTVKVVKQESNLDKAFENMFLRLEKTILKARPRLTPMPM